MRKIGLRYILAACGACLLMFADSLPALESPEAWQATASDAVKAELRVVEGAKEGKALCLAYDFNGVSGYAVARRRLPIDYPDNYRFTFDLRGSGPTNNLELKLVDASGENVWWVNRPNFALPAAWTSIRFKKRHISFAWGPIDDKTLRHSEFLEFTVSAGKGGGRGEVCFDNLKFGALSLPNGNNPPVIASASGQRAGAEPAFAIDADPVSAWQADSGAQWLLLDLGRSRELGGLTLVWLAGQHASRYLIELSDDGIDWRESARVLEGNGGEDLIALPEAQARWIRLQLQHGPGASYALADIRIEPLEFAATTNDLVRNMARSVPRGRYPRGFSGEQAYWTIIGIDGGREQGLIGEDGAIEVGKGGFSIEPFLVEDGKLLAWADMQISQSLADDYLPIPSVHWKTRGVALDISAFARGTADSSQMVARYRLTNVGSQAREWKLALAIRPLQVNPPSQFLNTVGGASPIHQLAISDASVSVNQLPRVFMVQRPDSRFASRVESGDVSERLAIGDVSGSPTAASEDGLVSGALIYRIQLAPGESREVDLLVPLTDAGLITQADTRADAKTPQQQTSDFEQRLQQQARTLDPEREQQRIASEWKGKLNSLSLRLPAPGQAVVDTLRTALAHMLISRIGPRLQPGTRSYARAWIRDGAMIAEGLLRLGQGEVAEDFVRWYAPYQFASGKVPCCVDDRGSDPVPENDSHGELIHAIAELYRYRGDRALLQQHWPQVQGAVRYMDQLRRSERTEKSRQLNPAFYGLMPASISHEGYSAKPMHSYWDDFWALRGYKDAVDIARWLDQPAQAQAFAASRDEFSADLYASLQTATRQHGIAFLPGSAELGDFDATSTTIALAPGGEQQNLPAKLLHGTFERYWQEFEQRRDGRRDWQHYTPYELRNIGAFVRLGWRERAGQALQYFLADRTPQAWNQWAEVVARKPRDAFFLGDLPHAWVASDYVRSALDMFAYEREADQSVVIAAGVPLAWFDGESISIAGLRTPYGELKYALRRDEAGLHLQVSEGLHNLRGGVVLPWPGPGKPGVTTVNGQPARWDHAELRLTEFPASVLIRER